MKSKLRIIIFLLAALTVLSGCEKHEDTAILNSSEEEAIKEAMLKIQIGDYVLTAEFADTEAAQELREKLEAGSVTVSVSNYGGWEKVGELPWSLTQSDVETDAVPGDIMLYRGDSIVLFYGENSWAYTRLGTVLNEDTETLSRILGGSDSVLTLSLEGK